MATIPFDIPHALGTDEARRRVQTGLPKLAQHIPGGGTVSDHWTGTDAVTLTIIAMGQSVEVQMTIGEANLSGTVKVPMMLSMMSGPIADFVKTSAEKMLAKPASQ
ncbi:MAG: polyhydroxyalkanoic acid system family protein [Sphingomonas taxi]